jgi:protein SCO1/2
MPLKTIRLALWIAVAIALFVLGALTVAVFTGRETGPLQITTNQAQPGTPLGGPFSLTDSKGQPVTEAVFRDKPSAVFFGFTQCPDVCPGTLIDMTAWMEALGEDAERMRFVFVTVDPERDTPEILDEYVTAFSEDIVGVTGDPEAVRGMLRDYGIFFERVDLEGGGYTMNHTASVFLLDEEGALVGAISREEGRETALAKLERLVAG